MLKNTRAYALSKSMVLALIAALLLLTGLQAPVAASELRVHVSVVVTGHVDGLDEHHLVEIAEHALEAAHIIAEHHGGQGIIEVHIEIHSTADHHGCHLAGQGGDWHEDEDADVVGHVGDVLVEMIHHFIDKASHH